MKLPAVPPTDFADVTLNFERLQALLTTRAWIAPTLLNSWTNAGGSTETAGYLKDPLGFVHLKGNVSGGATGAVVFTLPAGYRPGATMLTAAPTGAAVTQTAQLEVLTSGNVLFFYAGGVVNMWLSGTVFLAEN